MDLSASTSFESANSTPEPKKTALRGGSSQNNSYLGESMPDPLSTTIYKSFNDSSSDMSHNSMFNKSTPNNYKLSTADLDEEHSPAYKLSYASPLPQNQRQQQSIGINTSMLLQSESTDTNTSQEEVDPKSLLANKAIFKTDNPNLSIVEINDNSFKEQDLENKVLLVEPITDDNPAVEKMKSILKKSPSNADKRRRKTESFIQSSKQKLDISIAEASAAADGKRVQLAEPIINLSTELGLPQTKRQIEVYSSLEEFDKNLPKTVTLLNTPFGSKVYLVGTAHFSEESQDDVSYVIRNVRPDVVMVELCPSRIHILKLDEKTLLEEAKNINISKIRGILQTHGYVNGIFFILLLQMSAQIAKDLGMAPGGEFRRAFEEIHKLPSCILHLGDRPIRITLYRALHALSFWQTVKLVWRLTFTETISIEEVEECKQSDLLEKLMQEMAGEFPAFSEVFVRERDLFLCHSLQLAALPQAAPGSQHVRPVRVVGVVGIGHANGIAQMWGKVDPEKIPSILEIPPASLGHRICKYTFKYGLIGLGLYGAFRFVRPRVARLF